MHAKAFGSVALAAMLIAGAALSAQSRSADLPKSSTAPAGAQPVTASDREFIAEMTSAGLVEMQLAQMTVEQAASEDVKAYGQTMLRDHGQANAELAQIAKQLKVTPPKTLDRKQQDLVAKLSKLRGPEFDREYMAAMVESHRNAADQLRVHVGPIRQQTRDATGVPSTAADAPTAPAPERTAAAAGVAGGDASAVGTTGLEQGAPALREWAAKTLPAVEQHLKQAEDLQKTTR